MDARLAVTLGPEFTDELLRRGLRWSDAKALGGESLEISLGEGHAPLTMKVTEATLTGEAPHMVQFSLVLRGPAAPRLPQRMFRVSHARLGDYAILITPIAGTATTTDYEACFSHAP